LDPVRSKLYLKDIKNFPTRRKRRKNRRKKNRRKKNRRKKNRRKKHIRGTSTHENVVKSMPQRRRKNSEILKDSVMRRREYIRTDHHQDLRTIVMDLSTKQDPAERKPVLSTVIGRNGPSGRCAASPAVTAG